MMLAACANDEDNSVGGNTRADGGSIVFNPGVTPVTRTGKTGQEAATALGGKFYVYAIKNEETAGTLTSDNLVFDNYKVEYKSGSENTTTSNTAGWEYVGKKLTDTEAEHITDNGGTGTQLIKYWDNNANDYTFYAFAVNGNDIGNDITDGHLSVKKNTDNSDPWLNGYTMTVDNQANPAQIYIANRKHLTAADWSTDHSVTFNFCGSMAKVRVAMYETIPGYSVKLKAFRIASDKTAPAFGEMTTETTDKFAANLTSNKPGKAGVMTVTYNNSNSVSGENAPVVTFAPAAEATSDNVLTLGDNLKASTKLTTTAANPVYDKYDETYTPVYPMENNASNLKLKVDFTLESAIGETIEVTNATAEVPAEYLKWKPGYAYTYIFKISDQTNATVGSLTGLHPITFDAVAITNGTGQEEVISTTGDKVPNIVTMGYNPDTDSITVGEDDYNEGNTIYAAFVENNNVVKPTTGNTSLYVVTTTDADNYPVTESTVESYLEAYKADNTLLDQTVTAYEQTLTADNYVTTVPMGNGSTEKRSLNALTWKAGRHVYAVAYTYNTTDGTATKYKIVGVDGYKGKTTGTLALSLTEVANTGGKIIPTLTVDGNTPSNAEVSYALDHTGTYGAAVPSGFVTVTGNNTADAAIIVQAGTTPTSGAGRYTVIATYNRRTYRASFTVNQ